VQGQGASEFEGGVNLMKNIEMACKGEARSFLETRGGRGTKGGQKAGAMENYPQKYFAFFLVKIGSKANDPRVALISISS